MDWDLAIEKNQAALRRVLATLVALAGMGEPTGHPSSTLPRHLHRFILRLLRPAEAAMRRLIIVAARGLTVTLPMPPTEKGEQGTPGSQPNVPRPDPRTMPEWARLRLEHGLPIEFPRGEPIPLWAREAPAREARKPEPRVPFFPMFDPMKRFGRGPVRRRIPEGRTPRIALLNDDGWSVPLHLRRAPPPPPAPTPDDPLDAATIHRRLERIGQALDDLPRQALRFARWQARQEARRAAEREAVGGSCGEDSPSPSRPPGSPPLPHFVGERNGCQAGAPASPPRFLAPMKWGRGGEGEARDGEGVETERDSREASLIELGLTPEAIAVLDRSRRPGRPAQSSLPPASPQQLAKPRRFHRISPMRPGRPPGWRKRQNHEVYEVLNELHGLAVWASERRDSS